MRNIEKTKKRRMAAVAISLVTVIFFVCVILLLVSLRVQLVRVGYEIEGIRRQRTQLTKQQKLLLSELACAGSPDVFALPGEKSDAKFVAPNKRCSLITQATEY